MKKLLITAAAVLASLNLMAQGTVNFLNSSTTRVYVDSVQTGTTGAAAAGYAVALYYAADGVTAEDAFVQLGGSAALTGGVFNGGNRTAPITPPGGFGNFQVRGWTTAYANSYESALLAPRPDGLNKAGKSGIVRVDTGDPTAVPPGTPGSLPNSGFTSFALTPVVPEPSAIALGILGAGALLLLRRRK
jgi:hypothetical protein